MKNKLALLKDSFDKKTLLITIFLLIFSMLIVCQNSAFIFNPFILILLCLSYVVSFISLLVIGTSLVAVGSLINISYGLELLLIVILIIIYYLLSTLFKKENIKNYFPCIFINLTVFLLYLLTSNEPFYAINSLVLILLSLTFSLVIIDVFINIKKKEQLNEIKLTIAIMLTTSIFFALENIMFIYLIIVLILTLRIEKRTMYLLGCWFSFFLFYLFSETSINVLISIYLSLFLVGLFDFKYCYLFFPPVVALFLFSINETFYMDQIFFQTLIGFAIALLIPRTIVIKIQKFVSLKTTSNISKVVEYQNSKLNDISRLCDLLMDDRFDKFDDLDKVLERTIKNEVCKDCSSLSNCSLVVSKFLSGYLSNNEKSIILNNCIYPYQLTKAINAANKRIIDYSEREIKSIESKKIMNNAYQIIRKYIDLYPQKKVKNKNYCLEIVHFSKEVEESCNGDYLKIIDDEEKSIVMLSDGMGHTSKSKAIAEYIIELLSYLFLISNDVTTSIESCNQIILAKTYEEIYGTLDFCEFDLEMGNAHIYKAGSFPCYLIRNKNIKEISTQFPPIGIIGNIKVEAQTIELQHNDILIFMSDGFKEEVKNVLESTTQKAVFLPFRNYVKFLFNKLEKESNLVDDKTIIGIKIIKS